MTFLEPYLCAHFSRIINRTIAYSLSPDTTEIAGCKNDQPESERNHVLCKCMFFFMMADIREARTNTLKKTILGKLFKKILHTSVYILF